MFRPLALAPRGGGEGAGGGAVLIDEFAPTYDTRERHSIVVRAGIERVYDVVRRLDLGESFLIRALFRFR